MDAKNKPNSPKRPTLEQDIADVSSMSDAEVQAELDRYQINAEPAIRKIKEMVQNKMSDWKRRGILHAAEEVTHAGRGDD